LTISLDDLTFLASEAGERLLARLAHEDLSDANGLRLITALRREVAPSYAGATLELARLRQKAVQKFGADAAQMFFTREALEQASDPLVRTYRSTIAANRTVIDACCSIGADSLAMARAGGDVLGLDLDPVRVQMARHNAEALGISAYFEVADVREGLPESEIAFFDPARRIETGQRVHNVEQYEPPLSLVREWEQPLIVVKLSPGIELAQIAHYDGYVEFISVQGDLKEATLVLGLEQRGVTATLITPDEVLWWPQSDEPAPVILSEPLAWLAEPDASLLRAGLVSDAAAAFSGAQLDETIAYFTTNQNLNSAWVRTWRILDWMPFNVKALRAYLRERNVGQVTIKKRGTAVTPDELMPQLKLKGDDTRVLVLTRCKGRQIVVICEGK
jgi:hypothetical protein